MFWHLFWVHVWNSVAEKILCQICVWGICYSPALVCNGHCWDCLEELGCRAQPLPTKTLSNVWKTAKKLWKYCDCGGCSCLFLGKGYVRGFLSCLDQELGGSRSTGCSELWLLPQKQAHLLPCVCVCLILLLTEAGSGGFSGVEGFLQPSSALWGRVVPACSIKSVCLAHHLCYRSAPGLWQDSGLCWMWPCHSQQHWSCPSHSSCCFPGIEQSPVWVLVVFQGL